jgi:hypothetical protein
MAHLTALTESILGNKLPNLACLQLLQECGWSRADRHVMGGGSPPIQRGAKHVH